MPLSPAWCQSLALILTLSLKSVTRRMRRAARKHCKLPTTCALATMSSQAQRRCACAAAHFASCRPAATTTVVYHNAVRATSFAHARWVHSACGITRTGTCMFTSVAALQGCAKVAEIAKPEFKARMTVPLAVAGAFHTNYMAPAVGKLKEALAAADFQEPQLPVVSNVDAQPHSDPDTIRDILARQARSLPMACARWFDEGLINLLCTRAEQSTGPALQHGQLANLISDGVA